MTPSAPRYTRDRLARVAADSRSLVDMLRRLDRPLGTEPLRYLRKRLVHHGIETGHFVDEPLPDRPRRRYTEPVLREAAGRSTSLRDMAVYLGIAPYSSMYSHLARRLRHFGIDTSHFTARPSGGVTPPPEQLLREAAKRSLSMAGLLRELGLTDTRAARNTVRRAISAHGISTRHFAGMGHNRGRPSPRRKPADEILQLLPPGARRRSREQLHRALREKDVPYRCEECGLGCSWQGRRLVLAIDHRNGDRLDNRLANLRYLCPSCHSQTDSFGRRSAPRSGTQGGGTTQ